MGETGFSFEDRARATDVVLHAAERSRLSLLRKLTDEKAMERLLREAPAFYARAEGKKQELGFTSDELRHALPADFFADPTGWIESQKIIDRGDANYEAPQASIGDIVNLPFDPTRVRIFDVTAGPGEVVPVVSKRLSPRRPQEALNTLYALEAGLPVPPVLARIADQGNTYLWSLRLPALSDMQAKRKLEEKGLFWTTEEWNGAARLGSEAAFDDLIKKNPRLRRDIELYNAVRESYATSAWLSGALAALRDYAHSPGLELNRLKGLVGLRPDIAQRLQLGWMDNLSASDTAARVSESASMAMEQLTNIQGRVSDMLFQNVAGYSRDAEMRTIDKKAKQAGIRFGDQLGSNILIPWDFEKDLPEPPQDGMPRMYLTDWEFAKIETH